MNDDDRHPVQQRDPPAAFGKGKDAFSASVH